VTAAAAMASPVVAAIVAAAASAMTGPLDDVVVLDSIDPAQAYAARSLTIGGAFDEDLGLNGVEAVLTSTSERGAGRRIEETTSVACVAYAGGGDLDLPGYRAQAGAIVTALRGALRQLTAVDGVPARAQLTDQAWLQMRTDNGDGVIVDLTVLVTSLP